MFKSNKQKFIFDMFLNVVATAVPAILLQLFILPSISTYMSNDRYGLLITVLAFLNVVPSTMGNALNNIRLIYNENDFESGTRKDFNVILLILATINIFIVALLSFFYEEGINFISLTLTLVTATLWLLREYYIVAFRIKIDYWAMVVSNLLMVIGYGFGFIIFHFTSSWQYIYILGYMVSLFYIFSKCNLWREPLKISFSFKELSIQTFLLAVSNILSRITMYADKMLIFPILGGATVSVYYAATIFGKVISLIITPISSVILSYLSRENKKNDFTFKIAFLSGIVVCLLGYFFCLLISRPILTFIYPQFVEEAMNYIKWTTGTVMITSLISIINPFVLNYFDMKWQIIINGGTALLYVILTMIFLNIEGLTGFCIGAFLTNLIKLVSMVIVYMKASVRAIKN